MYFCSRFWRGGRVVDCGGLENRCPPSGGPGVRIPPSPPIKTSRDSGIFYLEEYSNLFANILRNIKSMTTQ